MVSACDELCTVYSRFSLSAWDDLCEKKIIFGPNIVRGIVSYKLPICAVRC